MLTAGNHTFGSSCDAGTATAPNEAAPLQRQAAPASSAPPPQQHHSTVSCASIGDQSAAAAQGPDNRSPAANSGADAETKAVSLDESAAPEAGSAAHGRSQGAQAAEAHAQVAADPAASRAIPLPLATILPPAAEAVPAVLLQRTRVIAGHVTAVPFIISLYKQERAESGVAERVYGVRRDGNHPHCDMIRRDCGGAVPSLQAMLAAIVTSKRTASPYLSKHSSGLSSLA